MPSHDSRPWSLPRPLLATVCLVTCGVGNFGFADPPAQAVRMNTVGFRPLSPKLAIVAGVPTAGKFVIRESGSGREVLSGSLVPHRSQETPDGTLWLADFSSVQQAGNYLLEVEGLDTAAPELQVADEIYNRPFYASVRALYLLRCGTAVHAYWNGDEFSHEACHLDDASLAHADAGQERQHQDGTGGWHDAGDYNKYTVNGAFTAGMMLRAWEDFRDRLEPLRLDLPESDNEIPDYLDEIRWELEWLLKMQAEDGRVYHKLSTLDFGGFVLPEHETAERFFSPWSSAGTADLVAVLAQASRVYREFDISFADRCLAAAKKSGRLLQEQPANHPPDLSAFNTGPYDSPDEDDRLWAAAELWETTGDPIYLEELERRIASSLNDDQRVGPVMKPDWDWQNVSNLGLVSYLKSARPGRDPELVGRLREDAIQAANSIVNASQGHPYRRPLGDTYYWGCNGTVARQAILLHLASQLTGDQKYPATILQAINHLFGQNPFGRSYVTGVGQHPPLFPHDRRSGGDDVAAPWPGYLVGGPWPKATDWYDVEEDYRTNEVAINWNGALIYALAGFVEPDQPLTTATPKSVKE
ncbi:MAG: glycoside hydrolase family 9 protein [Planctomycetota bacterium]